MLLSFWISWCIDIKPDILIRKTYLCWHEWNLDSAWVAYWGCVCEDTVTKRWNCLQIAAVRRLVTAAAILTMSNEIMNGNVQRHLSDSRILTTKHFSLWFLHVKSSNVLVQNVQHTTMRIGNKMLSNKISYLK